MAGQPLHRFLGGGERADLPAYASLLRYGSTDAVACTTAQEPVWPPDDLPGLAEIRVRGGIPTAAGESELAERWFPSLYPNIS